MFMLMLFICYGGIEDKLVATDGYGIVVTDEASAFSKILKVRTTRMKAILD